MDTNCSFGWQYFTGSQGQGQGVEDGGPPRRQIGGLGFCPLILRYHQQSGSLASPGLALHSTYLRLDMPLRSVLRQSIAYYIPRSMYNTYSYIHLHTRILQSTWPLSQPNGGQV